MVVAGRIVAGADEVTNAIARLWDYPRSSRSGLMCFVRVLPAIPVNMRATPLVGLEVEHVSVEGRGRSLLRRSKSGSPRHPRNPAPHPGSGHGLRWSIHSFTATPVPMRASSIARCEFEHVGKGQSP